MTHNTFEAVRLRFAAVAREEIDATVAELAPAIATETDARRIEILLNAAMHSAVHRSRDRVISEFMLAMRRSHLERPQ
jgi:hypothetical protein